MGRRYDHVSLDERCEIYRLHEDGKSRRAIGRLLGRHPSTIGRRVGKGRRLPAIPDRLPIHMRPTQFHLRAEPGHWEANLMHFRGQKACLLTCVERRPCLLLTTAMTDKSADTTAQALSGLLEKIPKKARKTVTLNNGAEFYQHK